MTPFGTSRVLDGVRQFFTPQHGWSACCSPPFGACCRDRRRNQQPHNGPERRSVSPDASPADQVIAALGRAS